ncbi:MAG: SGNH/GDSL hydrolase family protein [Mycobacteriaceae bacterium]|nr:SGNH/GDSL hydrolase family protein [Mycobacteriaceae bacterium]
MTRTAQTLSEATDPLCLDAEQARDLLAGVPWRRFASVGDSIAVGIGDARPGYAPHGWPDRCAAALAAAHPQAAYLNTGVVGATTEQVLADQLDHVLGFRPDLVNVVCGANDLWLAGADLDSTAARLEQIFATVAGSGAQLSTFTLADVFVTDSLRTVRDAIAGLNDVIRALALRYDAVFVDFWQHPLRTRPDLVSADGIHFAAAGHAVVAAELIRAWSTRAALP